MIITINKANLQHNYLRYSSFGRTGAVIKSDAYGMSAVKIAQILNEVGCVDFFVADQAEGARVRTAVRASNIYILNGETDSCEGLIPVCFDLESAHRFGKKCWVQIDSGLSRLGIAAKDFVPSDNIEGVLTQLVSSEEYHELTKAQIKDLAALKERYSDIKISITTTGSIGYNCAFDLVRVGRALYGSCAANNPLKDQLKPVISLRAKILQTKLIKKGQGIGYHHKFIADRDMLVHVLNIGYAHGLPENTPWMLSVGMDLSMIDASDRIIGDRHTSCRQAAAIRDTSIDTTQLSIQNTDSDGQNIADNSYVDLLTDQYGIDDLARDCKANPRELILRLGFGSKLVGSQMDYI